QEPQRGSPGSSQPLPLPYLLPALFEEGSLMPSDIDEPSAQPNEQKARPRGIEEVEQQRHRRKAPLANSVANIEKMLPPSGTSVEALAAPRDRPSPNPPPGVPASAPPGW